MKLYLVRHGETEYNRDGRICGTSDIGLTKIGFEQAHEMALKLSTYGITKIYSSLLERAVQTTEIISKGLKLSYQTDPNLREISFGAFEGKYHLQAKRENPELWQQRRENILNFRFPNGESYFECMSRLNKFINKELKQFYCSENNILIVSHALVIQSFWAIISGNEIESIRKKPISYKSITSFTSNGPNLIAICFNEEI